MSQKILSWIRQFYGIVIGLIALLSALISLITQIKHNFYIGIVISYLFVVAILLLICAYIYFSRTQPLIGGGKGVYIFSKARKWAFFYFFLIIAVHIGWSISEPGKKIISYACNSPPIDISIEKILVSASDESIRIEVTTFNPSSRQVLIDNININIFSGEDCKPNTGSASSPIAFKFSDYLYLVNATTEGTNEKLDFLGSVLLEDSEFAYLVEGFFIDSFEKCQGISFSFDTVLILAANDYSIFYVIIPEDMKIIDSIGYLKGEEEEKFYAMKNYAPKVAKIGDAWNMNEIEKKFTMYIKLTSPSFENPVFFQLDE